MTDQQGKFHWTEPTPTKSGERVSVLWNQLLEHQQQLRVARLSDDKVLATDSARRVQEIQFDLGLTIEQFPEMGKSVAKVCRYKACSKIFIDNTMNHKMKFCCIKCRHKNRYHTVERVQKGIRTIKEYAIYKARINNGYEKPEIEKSE